MKSIKLFFGIAVCAVAMTASAQKVDFDNDPDGRGIYTEAGYVGYTVKTGTADRFEVSGADGRAFTVELNVGNTKDLEPVPGCHVETKRVECCCDRVYY